MVDFCTIKQTKALAGFQTFNQMRQSRVEIEGYSVAYFNHIAVFIKCRITELPLRVGGAHTCFIDVLDIHASMKHV